MDKLAIFSIVQEGDEILRQKAQVVRRFDERLHRLLDDMAETLHGEEGVGLAAPQIGVSKRVVVIDIGEGLIELVNPEIVAHAGEETTAEGCLSIKGPQRPGYSLLSSYGKSPEPLWRGIYFRWRRLIG